MHTINVFSQAFSMFLSIQEDIPEILIQIKFTNHNNFFPILLFININNIIIY